MGYSKTLNEKIRKYYCQMYQSVGLVDVEEKIKWRLDEEKMEANKLNNLEYLINITFGPGQKHLIVGTGTGGLAVELHKKDCQVYGIEPNKAANEIVLLKADEVGLPQERFLVAKAEAIPFNDNSFDFIHCVTVIEHVDNVKQVLFEMVRVLKPGGYLYLNTPDYRFPYEGHYKITFPSFLPKVFGYLYLLVRGKPTKFLKHLNYVTEKNLNRILYKLPVVWQRIYRQHPPEWNKVTFRNILWKFFTLVLNIPRTQEIIIRKKAD